MPVGKTHFVYLLTKKGVYKTIIEPALVAQSPVQIQTAFSLYQNVLNEVRNCQLKDRAANQ